ncbi:hypothetical protein BV20DRAFT_1027243 [Pilatotrama ljubarskyi]|nr:hypothetical protein BV20DRAFT_1027243 [Pilatotrama ljubarskyi]
MAKGKLRLKRTPAEEAERQWRKAQKAARKAAKRRHADEEDDPYDDHRHGSSKRQRTEDSLGGYEDSDSEYGPQPASSSSTAGSHRAHKPDYDRIQAEIEEMRFREKLQEAMGEDERLDTVEASMNSYAHIPRRWRGGGMDRMDDELGINPAYMEEEDYAEWVREGMWRKKHAAEHEERVRREAERKARRERQKALREETRRLELAAEEERRKRRSQKERLRAVEARESYEARWKELLAPGSSAHAEGTLRFGDVPWPVMPPPPSTPDERPVVTVEDLTAEAIAAFLLPPSEVPVSEDAAVAKKDRKEKLRETMLRFHPDKFEGRIMRLVRPADLELVKEAVGIVARTLNTLLGESK